MRTVDPLIVIISCADPGIFVRGVQVLLTYKKSSDNMFFPFFSPQLILHKSNGYF